MWLPFHMITVLCCRTELSILIEICGRKSSWSANCRSTWHPSGRRSWSSIVLSVFCIPPSSFNIASIAPSRVNRRSVSRVIDYWWGGDTGDWSNLVLRLCSSCRVEVARSGPRAVTWSRTRGNGLPPWSHYLNAFSLFIVHWIETRKYSIISLNIWYCGCGYLYLYLSIYTSLCNL